MTISLNATRSGTSSQCKSSCSSCQRPRSNFLVLLTTQVDMICVVTSQSSERSASIATRILQPKSCLCTEQFTVFGCRGFVCQRVPEEAGRLESRCGFLTSISFSSTTSTSYELQVKITPTPPCTGRDDFGDRGVDYHPDDWVRTRPLARSLGSNLLVDPTELSR